MKSPPPASISETSPLASVVVFTRTARDPGAYAVDVAKFLFAPSCAPIGAPSLVAMIDKLSA